MRIQLYDRGTPKGKQLFSNIENVCKRLQIDYDPEFIKDMNKIYNKGVQGNTIMTIDNEIVLVDRFPNIKELENIISDYLK